MTRKELRDLDIETRFIEGIVQRDPHYVEALQVLGANYTRRGQFRDGLKVDERLARLRPDDPMVLYNLACSYSLNRQIKHAADALNQAIEAGYHNFRLLLKDPDLENLRQHSFFKRIQEKIRAARIKIH